MAAGRNPAHVLTALTVEAPRAKTLSVWAEEFQASRIDVADGTTRNHKAHIARILPTLGDRDPHALTVSDVQTWVAGLIADEGESKLLKPASAACYVGTPSAAARLLRR